MQKAGFLTTRLNLFLSVWGSITAVWVNFSFILINSILITIMETSLHRLSSQRLNIRFKNIHFMEEFFFYVSITHYENTPMLYTAIFHGCKKDNFQIKNYDIFLFVLLKTYIVGTRSNRLSEAVLTSTHILCFRAKVRK